ncbi:MAG TPA: zf-HC2 domain-containing protein, partial [Thermoanaerobaculia bacterium]|nr:zf-HC2 domain-containing protein [Thermoanaerobaculia bacterium]
MSGWHPDPSQLERFLNDDLPDEESRTLQRHLFACPDCEERLIRLLPGRGPSGADRAIGWPAAGG